ncbi:MAG TPA: hypothetical protein PKV40_06950, partial [Candidatus Kapabacteria bacterium]|nr:hypothetical protein [Candidatus Kapabacteria bacterium]
MKKLYLLIFFIASIFFFPHRAYSQWELVPGWVDDDPLPLRQISAIGDTTIAKCGRQLLISTNKGNSWTYKKIGNLTIRCFLFISNELIVGTEKGIFISYDLGDTWIAKNKGNDTFSIVNIIYNEKKIYISSSAGIFYSTNDGDEWVKLDINNSLPFPNLKLIYVSGDTVWVQSTKIEQIGINFYKYGGSFLSLNHGKSWILRKFNNDSLGFADITICNHIAYLIYDKSNNLYVSTDMGENWVLNDKINGIIKLTISNANDLLVSTIKGLYLSTNTGENWTKLNSPLEEPDYMAMNNGNIWIINNYRQIYLSADTSKTWINKYNYIENGRVTSLASDNGILYLGTTKKLAISSDQGLTWEFNNNGLPEIFISAIAAKGDNIFVGTTKGLYVSFDKGKHWTAKANEIIETLIESKVYSISIGGSNIIASVYGGVLISYDTGHTWTFKELAPKCPFYGTAISGQYFFVGSVVKGLYVSSDMGSTWETKKFTDRDIYSIAINGNNVYAGAYNGLYRSTDMGNTWINTKYLGGYDLSYVIKVLTEEDNIFIVSYITGIFVSTNNATTFEA